MKLGPSVLLEIVSIVQHGLTTGDDVSQKFRDIDVVVDADDDTKVRLSSEYIAAHPDR